MLSEESTIKVYLGFTDNPKNRLLQLQTGNTNKLIYLLFTSEDSISFLKIRYKLYKIETKKNWYLLPIAEFVNLITFMNSLNLYNIFIRDSLEYSEGYILKEFDLVQFLADKGYSNIGENVMRFLIKKHFGIEPQYSDEWYYLNLTFKNIILQKGEFFRGLNEGLTRGYQHGIKDVEKNYKDLFECKVTELSREIPLFLLLKTKASIYSQDIFIGGVTLILMFMLIFTILNLYEINCCV